MVKELTLKYSNRHCLQSNTHISYQDHIQQPTSPTIKHSYIISRSYTATDIAYNQTLIYHIKIIYSNRHCLQSNTHISYQDHIQQPTLPTIKHSYIISRSYTATDIAYNQTLIYHIKIIYSNRHSLQSNTHISYQDHIQQPTLPTIKHSYIISRSYTATDIAYNQTLIYHIKIILA